MPLLLIVLALIVLLALFALSLPFSLVQRYRLGTSRRMARGWVITINFFSMILSAGILLVVAAISYAWLPKALPFTLMGLAGGCILGLLGLFLSRWEATHQNLHYTPNRGLVLSIVLVVTARLIYGFWRAWDAWRSPDNTSWLAASGAAGSMAAGAVVIGYYLTYWAGVQYRLRRHRQTLRGTYR